MGWALRINTNARSNFMKPLRDNILIRPFETDAVSTGGIIVPDSFKAIGDKAEVVAVGPGTKKSPMQFKEGDTVFRPKGNGTEVLIDGTLHFLIPQDWILAKMN